MYRALFCRWQLNIVAQVTRECTISQPRTCPWTRAFYAYNENNTNYVALSLRMHSVNKIQLFSRIRLSFPNTTRRYRFGGNESLKGNYVSLLQSASCSSACCRKSSRRTTLGTCSAFTGISRNARCWGTAPGRVKPVPSLPSLVSSTRSTPSKLYIIPRQWRLV